ncbi:MAG: Trk family potassium uptake protein [Clostridiales bacterium]|nr:Trk family potassium uptake protein [Clostridiales bacterium]
MKKISRIRLSPLQIAALGFIPVIFIGTLLLLLPFSTRSPDGISFLDALFTATSAVCVTGLAAADTASCFTPFGQGVILLMIQIGGMGVVTVSVFFAILSGRKIGLMQRSTMQEAIAAHQVGGIISLTHFIIAVVFSVEILGTIALAPVFCNELGFVKGMCYSVFHSVSAFCNAGFDLMGIKEPYSSLTYFQSNTSVNIIIMALIIVGGIGFLTWEDIKTNGLRFKKYRLQTKIILTVSFLLIAFPTVYFYFVEFGGYPLKERLLLSLFAAVSPRTAGFNTSDLNAMSEPSLLVTIGLMLIGGSPGSTAGGMKTTTAAVIVLSAFAVFRRKESPSLFGRRISDEAVKNSSAILFMYLSLFLTGGVIISLIEGLPLLTCLFETASAIGTVGLTLGITRDLCVISKLILILLMFLGRVGGLTVIFAALSGYKKYPSKYPLEKITVG